MNVYGLTGGPGCGKSTVSRFFQETGRWIVIDADAVCHDLYSDPQSPLIQELKSVFGRGILHADGTVNRKALAKEVLTSEDKLNRLNSIVHPAIQREFAERIRQAQSEDDGSRDGILLDVPLLFETGMESLATGGVIAVWADPAVQLERLRARGWSQEDMNARINAQLPASEKLARADYGLISRGDFSFLYGQCKKLNHILTTSK